MSEHTPGPWPFQTVRTSCGICHKIGLFPWKKGKLNSACIYVDYPGNGPAEHELLANAYLMAAAPDLLAALQELVARANDSDDAQYGTLSASFVRDVANTAIAKATKP